MNRNCASFPRHLGKSIVRALIAKPMDTVALADWVYGDVAHPNWHMWNVRRHCRMWGIKPIGKNSRRLVWALAKLED